MQRMPGLGLFLFVLLLLVLLGPLWAPRTEPVAAVPYSEFHADLQAGRVAAAKVTGQQVTAEYRDGRQVRTVAPPEQNLSTELRRHGVQVDIGLDQARPFFASLLTGVIPIVLVLAVLWFFLRPSQGAGGQIMQFSQTRAQLYQEGQGRVTLSDVAGLQEVKEDLEEIIDFLKAPDRYRQLGARIPKGVLLTGPPGTGKTLLARAVAGEAGVAFYSVSGSEFVEMFAGVGASRVRDLFQKARKGGPCIVFIDEIDAVARHRGLSLSGANEEREQTLNQLLVEMDGFGPTESIIIIAATNRPDVLDPAILRPGRFDRIITVDLPDVRGREAILGVHARGKPLDAGVDLGGVARQTPGFSGADLANLLNEAALLTARRRKDEISHDELQEALERIQAGGPVKHRLLSPRERRRVAVHEAGHAVVSRHLAHSDPVLKVSIVARGRAGGYTVYRPQEERLLHTREQIVDRITSILGGRAAEEVCLGEVSTGASDDLERATDLARRMVAELGMAEEVGPIRVGGDQSPSLVASGLITHVSSASEQTVKSVDEAVRRLIGDAYQRASDLLQRHKEGLERVAAVLLERETIDGSELERILKAA